MMTCSPTLETFPETTVYGAVGKDEILIVLVRPGQLSPESLGFGRYEPTWPELSQYRETV
jgi:hypothetical protein